jgi:hypothetical protein
MGKNMEQLQEKFANNNIGYMFIFILLIFLIASGAVFIHYGNKVKNGNISNDDKQAGQFILSFGVLGLIANIISSIMLGYYLNYLKDEQQFIYIAIYIIAILFTTACNVILIIYGLKMHQNNICINTPNCQRDNCVDDYKLSNFVIMLGSICIIFGCLSISFLVYQKIYKNKHSNTVVQSEEQSADSR